MDQDERHSVYNFSTGNILENAIEKKIKGICLDEVANEYLKTSKVFGGKLYECAKLVIHGTEYHKGHFSRD